MLILSIIYMYCQPQPVPASALSHVGPRAPRHSQLPQTPYARIHAHAPNIHVASVEAPERCFHVLAMSLEVLSASNDVARTWKHISVSSTSAAHSPNVPM